LINRGIIRAMPDHSHRHDPPAPEQFGAAFAIGVTLNVAYVIAQIVYGISAHSLALLADAGHNFSDVLGLLLAWGAIFLGRTRATPRRTYGLGRSSILAALINSILLLVAVGGITWEAIRRFTNQSEVAGKTVMIVAALGIVINGITALLFVRGQKTDLNIKGAFVHMAADAAVSAAVVIAGLIIIATGWHRVDPVTSLLINAVIVYGTWGLLRHSLGMALDLVPANVDPTAVRSYLETLNGVTAVHDLHIWPLSTTRIALTVHLEIPNGTASDEFLHGVCEHLHTAFGIEHSTIQIERNAEACSLAP